MRPRDFIGVLEAIYRITLPEREWLAGIHTAAHASMNRGLGTAAFLYDATTVPIRVWNEHMRDLTAEGTTILAAARNMDEAYIDSVARRLFVGVASEGPDFEKQRGLAITREHGVKDAMVINAYDPSGVGVYLGAMLPRVTKLGAKRRHDLERLGAHVACALALRCRLPTSSVEAVLTPGGRVEHADAEAKEGEARSALRDATLAIERARGKRRDEDGALASWSARTLARWTLVDQFESDGKRYVVARKNEVHTKGVASLAPREEQVLALLAAGRTSKLAAYELGLAPATVRVLLGRAASKLGARSSADAVAKYRALRR